MTEGKPTKLVLHFEAEVDQLRSDQLGEGLVHEDGNRMTMHGGWHNA